MHRTILLVAFVLGLVHPALAQADDPPKMTPKRTDVKPFEYVPAKVPFYPPGQQWGKLGPPQTKMQKPLDAGESIKHFVTPADFEVTLFASEPLIKRPIAMAWDERGRLWLAESVDYPNELKPPGQGRDRIVVCEDTDGDGTADKVTVFADKLSIPTSLAFYRGGVIVHQAPHTLYLKDTDGDGIADERKILFTGWSTADTHAGPSNLHWGFDNWLWGIVGYSGFKGTVGGEKHDIRTGFYRFRPDGSKFEFLRNTNNNSWGVGFSEEGLVFGSTANGNPSVYLPIPNRYYERVRGWSSTVLGGIAGSPKFHPITDKVRQVDHHEKFTAAAGHALYTARLYPEAYWNRAAFVCEPTGHLVDTFVLKRNGSDFTSTNPWNLLASDDEWSSPTMAEVGPDGCVWVIDWYNYIIQHNPTPLGFENGRGNAYETALRDKKHGRVYRLVPKNAKVPAPFTLKDATPAQLVAALKNDNLFWRRHAQRLLVERGELDVVPALVALVEDASVDAIGLNPGAIHALWTLHGLGASDKATDANIKALRHKSAGVRRNALMTLPRTPAGIDALVKSDVLADDAAHVRLAALLAIAEMPADPRLGQAVAAALLRPEIAQDRWTADAATSAAAANDLTFLLALAANKEALSVRANAVAGIVAEHYARGGPGDSVEKLTVALAQAHPQTAQTIVAKLAAGWPKNQKADFGPDGNKAIQALLARLPGEGKGALLRLTVAWGNKSLGAVAEEIARSFLTVVRDEKADDAQRIAAARQLVELDPGGAAGIDAVLDQITPRASPALSVGLVEALDGGKTQIIGPALVKRLKTWTPATRQAGVRLLLSRPESTRLLLDAFEKAQLPLLELTLDQKQALAVHPDAEIARRSKTLLAKGGGLPSADRQKVVEELMPLTRKTGDVASGKAMFKKHCATCHTHSGEGNQVGPDLTGMAAHPKAELLVHIIDPSRSVEGNFRVYTVAMADGRVFTGLLASETKNAVELIDAQAKKQTLLRADIEQLVASDKSLMPEGFEKQVTPAELTDLLEFLTQRGQFLPLPLHQVATAVSTRGMFFSLDAEVERLVLSSWAAKTVKGVPFQLVDPRGNTVPNVVLLHGPQGTLPPKMPKSVKIPCNSPAKSIHLLSGISGWGFPASPKGTHSLTVRLHYADGKTEDHSLRNGEHFADYIRRVDVPGSEFAFAAAGNQQVRYLAVQPKRAETIAAIEFVKGDDRTAPIIVAVTVETK